MISKWKVKKIMKAVVTGASSGIGYEIAKQLSEKGYDIIAVARDEKRLNDLKEKCKTNVDIYKVDLSDMHQLLNFCEEVEQEDIEILVNNAGFGAFGEFEKIDLETGIKMIDVNIKALHILTYKFLDKMKEKNRGYILNIGSVAGFMPGPLMSEYYATKAYVLRLTQSINKELRKSKSKVNVCVCCPGPVDTNFNNVANVKFSLRAKTSDFVARKAIKGMFKKKEIICPGWSEKVIKISRKLFSDKLLAEIAYYVQSKKRGKEKR